MNVALSKKYELSNTSQAKDMHAHHFVIKKTEDIKYFKAILDKLNLLQRAYAIIDNIDKPIRLAKILKYPLIERPTKLQGN